MERGDTTERQQWEYKVVDLDGKLKSALFSGGEQFSEEQLNELGEKGWELVGTTLGINWGGSASSGGTEKLIFKRPFTD